MITSGGNQFKYWRELNRRVSADIRRFYRQTYSPIGTARDVLAEHVLETAFKYDWCPDEVEPSYDRTIGAMVAMVGRSPGTASAKGGGGARGRGQVGCDATPQDPEQILWMRRVMEDAMDWMFQFGMCPFRMVVDAAGLPRIIIPAFESGNFIARMSEVGEIEVGWHTYTDGVRKTNELQPDRHVGVYVWSKYKPMLDTYSPFTSVVARVRRSNLRLQMLWKNMQHADTAAAFVPLVTRSVEQARDVEHMNWDEALGDSLAFDPTSQTIDEQERTRMDDDAMHRAARIRQAAIAAQPADATPMRMSAYQDGTEVLESAVNPWFLPEREIPQGRVPASVTVPQPRRDIIAMEDWLEKRVFNSMRVPFEMMMKTGSANKTATETETSNRMFRGAVKAIRDSLTDFMEESWAQGMGKIEEGVLVEQLGRLIDERRFLHDEGGAQKEADGARVPSTAELSERQRERWLKGEGLGLRTAGERARAAADVDALNLIERESDRIIRRAQSLHVPVEPAEVRREVRDLVKRAAKNPQQTVNSQYLDVADELERRKGGRPEGDAQSPPRTAANDGASDLDAEERRLMRALRQRRRLKVFWVLPPVLDTGDIMFLYKEGAISDDVRNAVLFSKLDMPIDTPKGMPESERQLRIKHELDMAMAKQTHKFNMETANQKCQGDIRKIGAQARAKAAAPPGAGGGGPPAVATPPPGGGKGATGIPQGTAATQPRSKRRGAESASQNKRARTAGAARGSAAAGTSRGTTAASRRTTRTSAQRR